MSKPKTAATAKSNAAKPKAAKAATKPKAAKPTAQAKPKAPKFTTDVLETFAFGDEGILCLAVVSNENNDQRRSTISLCEDFSADDPRDTFTMTSWIYSMVKVSDDDVFIAYAGGTLGRGDPRTGAVKAVCDSGRQITKLCAASRGVFVIGLDGYVGHFDGDALTDLPLPGVATVYDVSEAPDGTIYAAAHRGGLFRREANAWKALPLGVEEDVRGVLALDATTALLCGDAGLCGRLEGSTFTRYQAANPARDFYALATYHGRLYVGAGFHGLHVLEGTTVVPFKDNVFSYRLATSDKYLFASGRSQAARFDGTGWLATAFTSEAAP